MADEEELSRQTRSNRQGIIAKMVREYHESNVRSSNENEIRATIRSNADKMGIDTDGFRDVIRDVKVKTPGELQDYRGSYDEVMDAIKEEARDIFGAAEIEARDKRAAKRAEKAKGVGDTSTDTNPRSDPNKGGAGKADGKGKAKDAKPKKPANAHSGRDKGGDNVVDLHGAEKQSDQAIKDSLAAVNSEAEQREGEALLDTAGKGGEPETVDNGETGTPKSQSAIAAEKLAAAKLDGPLN